MVQRASTLVSRHGLDPGKLLLLTSTKKASAEMLDRIKVEFDGLNNFNNDRLPTVKTFHSLAYHWVRRFWRKCGLGRYPSPLVTKAQQKKVYERSDTINIPFENFATGNMLGLFESQILLVDYCR